MKDRANRYLNSVIGRVQERIKLAKLSGKPIVYLKTDDMYVVNELMKNESFFINITFPKQEKVTSSGWDSSVYNIMPSFKPNENGFCIDLFKKYPRLFIHYQLDDKRNKEIDKTLYEFILLYTSIGVDKSVKSHIEYLRGQKFDTSKDQENKDQGNNDKDIKDKETELEKAIRNINHSMFLIITANNPEIPANIRIYTELIKVDAVSGDELKQLISDFICELEPKTIRGEVKEGGGWLFIEDEEFLNFLAQHLKGLSITKIKQILCQIKLEKGKIFIGEKDIAGIIRKEKEQLIATSDCLSLEKPSNSEPAGLEKLAEYLTKRKRILDNPEKLKKDRGLDLAKGVVVAGVPGSGKSMMAKYTAKLWFIREMRSFI